eukprot:CAMPEP_0204229324 /NCGR_PEP_ID=MMETSP0361-20130328/87120_1 /ASSEMBLY_ACC=CAM_ASM_000343 /TAXON_ID=268821 /ORGANISM="Scrippsiella Hangoei, Strain SHTV-5" /LENGTH=80 /DNA_ID=CAMNT_0051197741 /DNA_START=188 /DNA_END=427 /DNA_ORIENTATION=+
MDALRARASDLKNKELHEAQVPRSGGMACIFASVPSPILRHGVCLPHTTAQQKHACLGDLRSWTKNPESQHELLMVQLHA